ncbi:MAG: lipid II:glycine glycyltransferase FemX [Bullifex sp.]
MGLSADVREIPLSDLHSESVFQSSFWAEVKKCSWSAHAFHYRTGSSEGDILVLVRRILPFFYLAYSPFAPVLNTRDEFETVAGKIVKLLPVSVFLLRADFTYGSQQFPVSSKTRISRFSIQPEASVVISLEKELRYRTRAKRNLKKEEGVSVRRWEGDEKAFDAWYDSYKSTSVRDGFTARSRDYILNLLRIKNDEVTPILYLAEKDGVNVGGILNLRSGTEEVYLFGATVFHKEGVSSGYTLQDHAIREAKRAGVRRYDLFGIGEGHLKKLTLFKTSFGGDIVMRAPSTDYINKRFVSALYRLAENIRFSVCRD